MIDKLLGHLFGVGGPLRVRGIGFLALIGGLVYMGVTGTISPEAYIAITASVGGIYATARFMQDKD